jgi:hypothetical protein
MMKSGDLVRINGNVYGTYGRLLREGTFAIVVGPAHDKVNRTRGCLQIQVDGILQDISLNWLSAVNDA